MMRTLMEMLGTEVTQEELEFIQEHEDVEYCSYEGMIEGHGGDYYWDVKLFGSDDIAVVTMKREY